MAFDITDFVKSVPNWDTSREQIEYIHISTLLPDPDNFYSMDGISELAANIETAGLQQPIRVYENPDDKGGYIILSGHRRFAALQLLMQDDHERWGMVPCIVERDEVPLEARKLRLLLANRDTRKLTSADLDRQAADMEKYIVSLKEQGYSFPGRLSDYVAQCLGSSKTKLNRLKIIREGLIPEWKKLWEDGKINDSVGYALAHLDGETQDKMGEIYSSIPNVLTSLFVESIPSRLASIPESCILCPDEKCGNEQNIKNRIMGGFRSLNCAGCCAQCQAKANCISRCKNVKARIQPSGGSVADKLDAQAEKYRQDEQTRMDNLNRLAERFVAEHLNQGRLEDFILDAVYRNDVVDAFKNSVCKTYSYGSYADGFKFGFSPRSVCIEDKDGRVECTIVEFTDAVMLAALKLCIKNETVPEDVSGWQTGEPVEDGKYIIQYGIVKENVVLYDKASWSKENGWLLFGNPFSEYEYQLFAWIKAPD